MQANSPERRYLLEAVGAGTLRGRRVSTYCLETLELHTWCEVVVAWRLRVTQCGREVFLVRIGQKRDDRRVVA